MNRKALLVVVFLLCAAALALAGGKQEAGAEEELVLSALWFDDADESSVFLATMKDYLSANPNIAIDMQVIPWQDFEKKLKLMIAGGNPPDVARLTNNHVAMLYESLLDLEGRLDKLDEFKKIYFSGSMAFATSPDGNTVAIPTEATANGMLGNVTYLENVGVDIGTVSKSWDWDGWVEVMKKAVAGNEKARFGLSYDFSPHRWSTLLFQAGGRFLNESCTAMAFDNNKSLDALNFFKMLHDEGICPKSIWMGSEQAQEMFKAGLAVFHIGGSWWINAYAKDIQDFDWAAITMAKREIRSSVFGGKFIATFKGGKHEEEALRVMSVFSDQEHNAQYCRDTFNLSARGDNSDIDYPARKADFATMADELSVTPAYTSEDWKSPGLNKIYSYIREQIVEGLLGNQTMEQTMRNIQQEGNKYVK